MKTIAHFLKNKDIVTKMHAELEKIMPRVRVEHKKNEEEYQTKLKELESNYKNRKEDLIRQINEESALFILMHAYKTDPKDDKYFLFDVVSDNSPQSKHKLDLIQWFKSHGLNIYMERVSGPTVPHPSLDPEKSDITLTTEKYYLVVEKEESIS
jgi:hypothetical protein